MRDSSKRKKFNVRGPVRIPFVFRRTHRVHILSAMTAVLFALMLFVLTPKGSVAEPALAGGVHVKNGDAIYHQRCVRCHNKQPGDTTPFGPPNLYSVFRGPSALSATQAKTIIAHGKGAMPAFGSTLSKGDIGDVIAYLKASH
jgi:mono/diheme cytochrome c family protein